MKDKRDEEEKLEKQKKKKDSKALSSKSKGKGKDENDSSKKIVKKCHTLISSGDHPLLVYNPRLTTSRYLAPIVRQFVKFCDMLEVRRKHCCTTREVP